MELSPQERPRTGASNRILADLDRRITNYTNAIAGAKTHEMRMLLTGWRDALRDCRDEMSWRLRQVEYEAELVPAVEPERQDVAA